MKQRTIIPGFAQERDKEISKEIGELDNLRKLERVLDEEGSFFNNVPKKILLPKEPIVTIQLKNKVISCPKPNPEGLVNLEYYLMDTYIELFDGNLSDEVVIERAVPEMMSLFKGLKMVQRKNQGFYLNPDSEDAKRIDRALFYIYHQNGSLKYTYPPNVKIIIKGNEEKLKDYIDSSKIPLKRKKVLDNSEVNRRVRIYVHISFGEFIRYLADKRYKCILDKQNKNHEYQKRNVNMFIEAIKSDTNARTK